MSEKTHLPNPCGNCPPIPIEAPMDKPIAVGFGEAYILRDGEMFLDGERICSDSDGERCLTFADAEAFAAAGPGGVDWQVVLNAPLHNETYQRQAPGKWVVIESGRGFA